MKIIPKVVAAMCALMLLSCACYSQSRSLPRDNSTISTVATGAGKAAVIVVGSAAKLAWGTTKVAGKYVIKPAARIVFTKAAPAIGKFAIRKSAKYLLPMAMKLSVL